MTEPTVTLRNFRLWSFPCPADGHVHFAVPGEGILHTIHKKIAGKPGARELRAIKEMQSYGSSGPCGAREQFAGG